jgi:hypothetical protein
MDWEKALDHLKMGQINADPKDNWHQLIQKKIHQQIIYGSVLKYN